MQREISSLAWSHQIAGREILVSGSTVDMNVYVCLCMSSMCAYCSHTHSLSQVNMPPNGTKAISA